MTSIEDSSEVRIYGNGSIGGKGEGLVRINRLGLPHVERLKTHILTTQYYDRFLDRDCILEGDEWDIVTPILQDLGDVPIGVRSSATNEATVVGGAGGAIHAGENATFMLPNNHPDAQVRLDQARQAIFHIYRDFMQRQPPASRERMAIVINPIPGLFDDTLAGPFYYPYLSGVSNSFFPHALKTQDPKEGFARIAFGHGYATVLDDFPVISMATIRNPLPFNLLQQGTGQQYFYALDLTKNKGLAGEELETMKKLHIRFANFHKIRHLGLSNNLITIEELIQNDHFDFKTGLCRIMDTIGERVGSHFQIEFVFNLDFSTKPPERGAFHLVQLTPLPELKFESIQVPEKIGHTYLSTRNAQGHGIRRGVRYALVISPFLYTKVRHDSVRARIAEFNRRMASEGDAYMIVVPGRLGSKNRDWGICLDFKDVDHAAAIFEYGVDIAGRAEPLPEDGSLTGGIYGSHFLYMIQGGYDEDKRRAQTRMYGTQGTHFLTNLMCNNIIYGYISPAEDLIDPILFTPSGEDDPLCTFRFPNGATIYADSLTRRCGVVAENL